MAYTNNVNLFSSAPAASKVKIANVSQRAAANRGEYVSRQTAKNNDFGSQLDKASSKMEDNTKYTRSTADTQTQQTAKNDSSMQKNDVQTDDVQKADVQSDDVQATKAESDSSLKEESISPEQAVTEAQETSNAGNQQGNPEENSEGNGNQLQFMNSGNLLSLLSTLQQVETKATEAVNTAINAVATSNAAHKSETAGFTQDTVDFLQAHLDLLMAKSAQANTGNTAVMDNVNTATTKNASAVNEALNSAKVIILEGFIPVEETTAQPMAMEALLGNSKADTANSMANMLNMLSGNSSPVRSVLQGLTQNSSVQQTQVAAQAEAQLNTAAVQEDNTSTLANLLGSKAEVTVEVQPNSQLNQQFNQNQQFGQDQSQQQANQMPVVNAEGEVQPMQMPGQAAFDVALMADSSQNADTSSIAGANFQQQFNMVNEMENPQQVQQPQQFRSDYDVPKQIVEQARLIKASENTEMVMKLNPEHLGELSLKVSVNGNGGVTATFHSDSATVRGIIETSMLQLKNELAEQGLKVDKVEVSAQLPNEQMPQDMGQGYYAQQQGSGQQKRMGNSSDLANYEDDGEIGAVDGVPVNASTEPIRDQQGNVISDGVDYKV